MVTSLINPIASQINNNVNINNKSLTSSGEQLSRGTISPDDNVVSYVVGSGLKNLGSVLRSVASSAQYGTRLLAQAQANLESVQSQLVGLRDIVAKANVATDTTLNNLNGLYKQQFAALLTSLEQATFNGRFLFDGSIADVANQANITKQSIASTASAVNLRISDNINNIVKVSIPRLLSGNGGQVDVADGNQFQPLVPINAQGVAAASAGTFADTVNGKANATAAQAVWTAWITNANGGYLGGGGTTWANILTAAGSVVLGTGGIAGFVGVAIGGGGVIPAIPNTADSIALSKAVNDAMVATTNKINSFVTTIATLTTNNSPAYTDNAAGFTLAVTDAAGDDVDLQAIAPTIIALGQAANAGAPTIANAAATAVLTNAGLLAAAKARVQLAGTTAATAYINTTNVGVATSFIDKLFLNNIQATNANGTLATATLPATALTTLTNAINAKLPDAGNQTQYQIGQAAITTATKVNNSITTELTLLNGLVQAANTDDAAGFVAAINALAPAADSTGAALRAEIINQANLLPAGGTFANAQSTLTLQALAPAPAIAGKQMLAVMNFAIKQIHDAASSGAAAKAAELQSKANNPALASIYDVLNDGNKAAADNLLIKAINTVSGTISNISGTKQILNNAAVDLESNITVVTDAMNDYLQVDYQKSSSAFKSSLLQLQGALSMLTQGFQIPRAVLQVIQA